MARTALTDACIGALRPRKIAYDIRDGKLGGFGVRVLPSGRKRFFVHSQHRGDRVWKILGDAATMSVDEARSSAVRTLAAIRRGEDPPRDPAETLFEAVAETVFERYRRLWKPGTLDVNRCYLKNQILPRFQGQTSRRHRPPGRPGLVRLAARDPGRRRPLNAGALRHLEGGGSHGSSARGLQPLPGHPTLPPQGTRALPVRRGDTPPVRETVGPRGNWASAAGRRHPAPPADGMPQERDPDAPLVRLPRGSPLPPRQQDWAPHRLAVAARPEHSRRAGPDRTVGVPGAARQRAEEQGLARRVSGTRFVPKPGCAACASTISVTPMPASLCGRARPC